MSSCSTITGLNQDDVEWCTTLMFVGRWIAYVAALALLAIIIFMVMRYLEDFPEISSLREERTSETNPLWSQKEKSLTYGTCETDLESGNCCSSSNGSSSYEDLYDGRVCVICYDEQRNCFFVPCGHCATCYICADRIFHGENKTCPVCRRLIGKVRKLFAS